MWYYAFYAGIVAVMGALACHLAGIAAGLVTRRAAAVTDAGTVSVSVRGEPPVWPGRLAVFLEWTGVGALSLMLVLRVVATGHPPYTNMWEYLTAFGWGTLLCYALFRCRFPQPAIAVMALALVLTLLILPEVVFSSEITPLVPALQNNRLLAIHVALMLLSYSVLAVAFAASVLFLVQSPTRRFAALPARQVLDELSYRAVLVGFPLLAAGIALGAYWGNIAWGRYWGWDPKETTALVTWFIFAAYLHARGLAKWQGARSAWLLVLGFGMIIFNIFAVNFWIAGLHSYA